MPAQHTCILDVSAGHLCLHARARACDLCVCVYAGVRMQAGTPGGTPAATPPPTPPPTPKSKMRPPPSPPAHSGAEGEGATLRSNPAAPFFPPDLPAFSGALSGACPVTPHATPPNLGASQLPQQAKAGTPASSEATAGVDAGSAAGAGAVGTAAGCQGGGSRAGGGGGGSGVEESRSAGPEDAVSRAPGEEVAIGTPGPAANNIVPQQSGLRVPGQSGWGGRAKGPGSEEDVSEGVVGDGSGPRAMGQGSGGGEGVRGGMRGEEVSRAGWSHMPQFPPSGCRSVLDLSRVPALSLVISPSPSRPPLSLSPFLLLSLSRSRSRSLALFLTLFLSLSPSLSGALSLPISLSDSSSLNLFLFFSDLFSALPSARSLSHAWCESNVQ